MGHGHAAGEAERLARKVTDLVSGTVTRVQALTSTIRSNPTGTGMPQMPTDLPPDYKPRPRTDPNNPADPEVPGSVPAYPPVQGEDARDEPTGAPQPGADVVDPPGWGLPPIAPAELPSPAGAPTF